MGEAAAAEAGAEAVAWSGIAHWQEDQTYCYQSQMPTPLLLTEEREG